MTLNVDHFSSFFATVNEGHRPFPWQLRFLDEVHQRLADPGEEEWCFPDLVDLPTGSGKTSIIDIAVFLLALEAGSPPGQRQVPRRIVFVVDRRVVVDQAHRHASHLARTLREATPGTVVGDVARALRSYAAGGPEGGDEPDPLIATVLRGGVTRDETWARRPDQPAVLSSTVDQVGSRLLFRGYGLSPSMQPIHAGLLGSDTLFVLDEVHLSEPFAQTLRSLRAEFQSGSTQQPITPRWDVVELSATPGRPARHPFRLDSEHGDLDPTADPTLSRRVNAAKPVQLAPPVRVRAGADRQTVYQATARACVDHHAKLLAEPQVTTTAIVVNRVDTAIAAYRLLQEEGQDAVLLTGRMRPHDRDRLLRDHVGDRLRTGRTRRPEATPFTVVATQCIEAGADFDFDAMVSEAASIDSLVQRFGRVDRDGQLAAAGAPAPGVVVATTADLRSASDPVYGPALAETWRALDGLPEPTTDFGISALPESIRSDPLLRVPLPDAPILLPAHLDAWVQTNPRPTPDPDPRFWLHGPDEGTPDVTIIWRADLDEALLRAALDERSACQEGNALRALRAIVVAAPPGAAEAMSVPLWAARRWLTGGAAAEVSDVERAATTPDGPHERGSARPFVRWAGDDSAPELISRRPSRHSEAVPEGVPHDLRPGDVVVVPAAFGGIGDHGSWDPSASDPVTDLAERTQLLQRRRALLRFLPGVLRDVEDRPLDVALPDLDANPDLTPRQVVRAWLDDHLHRLAVDQQVAGRQIQRALRQAGRLARAVSITPVAVDSPSALAGRGVIVTGPVVDPQTIIAEQLATTSTADEAGDPVGTDPASSSFTAVEVALDDHLAGVAGWARLLAANCGLSDELVDDLELAGRLHDLGKADPRFQAMLRGGDPIPATEALLAKSAIPADAIELRRAAADRAGGQGPTTAVASPRSARPRRV